MIVIVFGLPGSGKSYFAERLAKRMNADYVNSDRLRKELFPIRTYSDREKNAVYTNMLIKMQKAIENKRNLVLDATFHKKGTRDFFINNAKDKIGFIEVWADETILKNRLKSNRLYSEADFEVHQLIKRQWEPLEAPHLVLESTNHNIDEMLAMAQEYLKNDDKPNR